MEIDAYYVGYLNYIEITEEHIRISMVYWLFSDGFAKYFLGKDKPHVWRTLNKYAGRAFNCKEQWFIEYEKALRNLHVGDTVIFRPKPDKDGHHTVYQIAKYTE